MAVVNLNLPQFPIFETDEVSSIPSRWKKYKQRFALLCTAIGVTDNKQKLAMLLTFVGDSTYEIYENVKPAGEQNFDDVIAALDTHFEPQVNRSYETYLFHQMQQKQDETVHQYFIRLKEQAGKCDFHNTDKAIKQQIELSTINNKLRLYSFRNPEKSLQELLVTGKTLEETTKQAETIVKAHVNNEEVHAVNEKKTKFGKQHFSQKRGMSNKGPKPSTCYRCGNQYPHKERSPADGRTCNQCGKKGHYGKCCKTKATPQKFKPRNSGNYTKSNRPLNAITHSPLNQRNVSNDSDDEVLFCILTLYNQNSQDNKTVRTEGMKKSFDSVIRVENTQVNFLVDTGSSVNVLTNRTFQQLNKKLSGKLNLQKAKNNVVTYGNKEPTLNVLGKVDLLGENKNTFLNTTFCVINTTHKNLLSGTTAIELGIITFSKTINALTSKQSRETKVHVTNAAGQLNQNQPKGGVVPTRLNYIIENFRASVFNDEIGLLKGHKVKLHIDKNVTPVAQKERRIPFALRKKVNSEIEKLEKAGIVEDVTDEPTPWLNPIVVVPKTDGGIRLCIDMRCANKAIEHTRYPTPTVDDLKIELKGAKLFTKLDMKSAFHQVELTQDSRYITAFQSDTRVKRFIRLIFGANSASEELQHTIKTILSDIQGVTNIADDHLIFAKTSEEHDDILEKVLKRFQDKGLTLNLQKCIFCKENLEFYGYVFSKDGMRPSPKKVQAVKNTSQPEDAKVLRSFLGLTNYLKAFIPDYSTLTHPLRNLLKNDAEWSWNAEHEEAFSKLKSMLSSESCMSYFDDSKQTFLFTDASPYGISAILMQKSAGQNDAKIITYSSRALTTAEQNYAQIERECLSIVYGCERNRSYLIGRQFNVFNDHKALINILNNPKATVPLRIERLTLRLQGFDFKLDHIKSAENISDYPSRHTYDRPDERSSSETESYINFITTNACPQAITIEDIKTATETDKICQHLTELIKNESWYTLEKPSNYPNLTRMN